jgi:hypothetical protein
MNGWRSAFRDERGVAVVMALILLVAMTGLVLAFLSVSAFEPQISRNLSSTAQARYLAEAGLEWGFNALSSTPAAFTAGGVPIMTAQTNYWNAMLAAGGNLSGGPLQIPGGAGALGAAFGTFTVTVRNDIQANDNRVTGCPTAAGCGGTALDGGGAANDTNGIVIVTSTGTVGGVTKSVTAVVRRPVLSFGFNGAVSFPGTQADVNFSGNSFDISGKDWKMPPVGVDPAAPDGVNPAVWGIAVSTQYAGNESTVEGALSGQQQDNVTGLQENVALPGQGANTVNTDPGATSANVHDFIKALGQIADINMTSTQSNPVSVSSVNWGSPTNPVIVHVKGTPPDPTSAFTALAISGDSVGYGVLIVEDGDLKISGNFRWNGPIIVSGQYVGVGFLGGGNESVYGAVISNETASNEAAGYNEGVFTGNAKIRYSKEAIDLAMSALFNRRSSFQIYSWREN